MRAHYVLLQMIILLCLTSSESIHELQDIGYFNALNPNTENGDNPPRCCQFRGFPQHIFSKCKKQSPQFDACMKRALNDIRPYFKRGIPEIGVAPFDPHYAREIKQERSIFGIGYTLILRNVYESGWTKSTVTKFRTDWTNASIFYSQYFPEKYLEGQYEFKSDALGTLAAARAGGWNLTLRDYAQSTRVTRAASASANTGERRRVRVRVEIDRIGDMELHINSLLGGRTVLEQLLDGVINAFWKPGLVVLKPVINDLVSTAFTDIWSESFKSFHLNNFIKD